MSLKTSFQYSSASRCSKSKTFNIYKRLVRDFIVYEIN